MLPHFSGARNGTSVRPRPPRAAARRHRPGQAGARTRMRLDPPCGYGLNPAGSARPTYARDTMTPRLTQAHAPLTQDVTVLDEFGGRRHITIPAERALTVFVDNRELVTLMTLGAAP